MSMVRTTRRTGLITAGLFAFIWVIYVISPVTQSSDSRWTIPGAISLLKDGDLGLEEYQRAISQTKEYSVVRKDDHIYSYFPPTATVLATPFVKLFLLLPAPLFDLVIKPQPDQTREKLLLSQRSRVEKFIASIFVAGAGACIFLYAVHGLPISLSLAVALLFAFGTSAWSTASRAMWQHAPGLFFVTAGILLLQRGTARSTRAAGFASVISYMVRPTNALGLLWGLLVSAARSRRNAFIFVTGLLLAVPLVLMMNRYLLGVWIPSYFAVSRLTIHSSYLEALAANLVSPSRGLFIFSPFLVPIALLAPKFLGKWRENVPQVAALLVIIAHLFAVSAIDTWWGGDCYGPRYMTDVLPFFFVLLIELLRSGRMSKFFRFSLLPLGILSIALHAPGALSPRSMAWNKRLERTPDRVWDMKHPQFLYWTRSRKLRPKLPVAVMSDSFKRDSN